MLLSIYIYKKVTRISTITWLNHRHPIPTDLNICLHRHSLFHLRNWLHLKCKWNAKWDPHSLPYRQLSIVVAHTTWSHWNLTVCLKPNRNDWSRSMHRIMIAESPIYGCLSLPLLYWMGLKPDCGLSAQKHNKSFHWGQHGIVDYRWRSFHLWSQP